MHKTILSALSKLLMILLINTLLPYPAQATISDASQECIDCHAAFHPGIHMDWQKSRHALISPQESLSQDGNRRRISSTESASGKNNVVGCAECHTLRPKAHADTFAHNGYNVHTVVSPEDCAVCHRQERKEYDQNIMAHAYNNLAGNPVYQKLQRTLLGQPAIEKKRVRFAPENTLTQAEGCYYCHGTKLTVRGTAIRDTDAGEMEFPIIEGWPNQGVGRINPDGSKGACSACHARHRFSIETARKPYTCKECHFGPDVPAYKVYSSSKHGNLFSSHQADWNFKAVPWMAGRDFSAPTCAACHISALVNTDGATIVKRSHTMNDRLSQRIFGLIYAHAYPKKPDTTIIRNAQGLSLPTGLDGSEAENFLIDAAEQFRRQETMQAICRACHSSSWATGHFNRLENTVAQTNAAIKTATLAISDIWKQGIAQGWANNENPFDEAIERKWCNIWLFYGNTIRFSAAMAGGGDFGVFADGRYQMTQEILELHDRAMLPTHKSP